MKQTADCRFQFSPCCRHPTNVVFSNTWMRNAPWQSNDSQTIQITASKQILHYFTTLFYILSYTKFFLYINEKWSNIGIRGLSVFSSLIIWSWLPVHLHHPTIIIFITSYSLLLTNKFTKKLYHKRDFFVVVFSCDGQVIYVYFWFELSVGKRTMICIIFNKCTKWSSSYQCQICLFQTFIYRIILIQFKKF